LPKRNSSRAEGDLITKTERPRPVNLLQMPRGLMCKRRQCGREYGGPAGSRGIDPPLQLASEGANNFCCRLAIRRSPLNSGLVGSQPPFRWGSLANHRFAIPYSQRSKDACRGLSCFRVATRAPTGKVFFAPQRNGTAWGSKLRPVGRFRTEGQPQCEL
jgi:hypothetical protein